MDAYVRPIEIRWADLDPNFHMAHSKYYDLGAYCRIAYFTEYGIDNAYLAEHHFGPILFREECKFKKEIRFGDEVIVNLRLQEVNPDYSRWTIVHEIWKNKDILAAVITVDGAWMDTIKRKLVIPPAQVGALFESAPRTHPSKKQILEKAP